MDPALTGALVGGSIAVAGTLATGWITHTRANRDRLREASAAYLADTLALQNAVISRVDGDILRQHMHEQARSFYSLRMLLPRKLEPVANEHRLLVDDYIDNSMAHLVAQPGPPDQVVVVEELLLSGLAYYSDPTWKRYMARLRFWLRRHRPPSR